MKIKTMVTAAAFSAVLSLTQSGLAREKWPEATEADKTRAAGFRQHEQQVWKQIQPDLDAWARKGKPFIPWVAEPGDLPQAGVPAFPGEEGGGKFSFGGRGGKVYVVTNLDDSGPGTLREACEAAGPRVVVFNVVGVIHLGKPIFIEAPYFAPASPLAPYSAGGMTFVQLTGFFAQDKL